MTLGTGIVLGCFAYACSCRLSGSVSDLGITRGRRLAFFCLALGIAVDLFAAI